VERSGNAVGLQAFADAHGLSYSETATLPGDGALLGKNGTVEGAASGALPGGTDGTLAHYCYTEGYGRDQIERDWTIFVASVPETIGFAPYLAFESPGTKMPIDKGQGAKEVKPAGAPVKSFTAYAYEGTSDSWLTQLFSPVLVERLSQADKGFGFELASGILCVSKEDYLTDPGSLEALCNEAAYIARALKKESLEATDAGSAVIQGARSEAPDPDIETAIATVLGDQVPDHVGAMKNSFVRYLRRQPETYRSVSTIIYALAIALISAWFLLPRGAGHHHHHHHHKPDTYFFGGGDLLRPHPAAFVFAGLVFLISYALILGARIQREAKGLDQAAFYRGFARSRGLAMEDPLRFAATHAEAKVPFEPDWVLSGDFSGGRSAALAVKGDGSGRKGRIALVAGPTGPFAWSQLAAKARKKLSIADLDYYVDWLSKQLTGTPASSPP
jgi:hypothetical protein